MIIVGVVAILSSAVAIFVAQKFFKGNSYMKEDITQNFHKGNPRSIEAHESVREKKLKQQVRIMKHLFAQGSRGATCDETEIALNMPHQSCSARFSELKAGDHIVAKDKRKTRNWRDADVFVINREKESES
jgi:hypothetical protein